MSDTIAKVLQRHGTSRTSVGGGPKDGGSGAIPGEASARRVWSRWLQAGRNFMVIRCNFLSQEADKLFYPLTERWAV